MGRPAAGVRASDRIATSLRIEPDLHRRLEDEAERREVSVNWLIIRCVERMLPAYEAQDIDIPAPAENGSPKEADHG